MNVNTVLTIALAVSILIVVYLAVRDSREKHLKAIERNSLASAHRAMLTSPGIISSMDTRVADHLTIVTAKIRDNLILMRIPAGVYIERAEGNTDVAIGETVPYISFHGADLL